ncbi:unnamed protein product [Symbiodinium sp. CCMP2592]|nr:unnamed protein product [Symbiodinium sp. CCMP2592]
MPGHSTLRSWHYSSMWWRASWAMHSSQMSSRPFSNPASLPFSAWHASEASVVSWRLGSMSQRLPPLPTSSSRIPP